MAKQSQNSSMISIVIRNRWTEEGKRQSRRIAFRHGLTAETVIEILEDIGDLSFNEKGHLPMAAGWLVGYDL
jgi:hypothetical protein